MRIIKLTLSLIPPLLFIVVGPYLAVQLGFRAGLSSYTFPLSRALGALLAVAGFLLSGWSAWLLFARGEGTPLPLLPPKKFVAVGPYRHVRNPMLLGLFFIIAGEFFFSGSPALLVYLGGSVLLTHAYIVIIEENELASRFGDSYKDYKSKTPRWIPRH